MSEARLPAAAGQRLAHIVYFTLRDRSTAAVEKLLADCRRYLSDHPGTEYFAVGSLAPEFTREVNVRDYDVALHVVFENKDAHDRYQADARHLEFIRENKPNWAMVRVYDSYLL
jgi:hypothetical protein